MWLRIKSFVYRRILHTDDSPHAVALGVAVATWVAFMPILGLHTVLALALAACFRANKAVCIPAVWIVNPFTIVPIYGGCWWFGHVLLGRGEPADVAALAAQLASTTHSPAATSWTHWFSLDFWRSLAGGAFQFGLELWVGCLLGGVLAAAVLYLVTRQSIVIYRRRLASRRMRPDVVRREIHQTGAPTVCRKPA